MAKYTDEQIKKAYVEQCTANAKSEAIKEFAERLKEKMFCQDFLLCEPCDMADIIDNLVKEMVGENDG